MSCSQISYSTREAKKYVNDYIVNFAALKRSAGDHREQEGTDHLPPSILHLLYLLQTQKTSFAAYL